MKTAGFLKKYFWDIDVKSLKEKRYSKDILLRLLEYGDEKAARWMMKNFTKDEVEDALYHFRNVSARSANFWALIFGINRKKVLCLQKPYLEIRKRHWPY